MPFQSTKLQVDGWLRQGRRNGRAYFIFVPDHPATIKLDEVVFMVFPDPNSDRAVLHIQGAQERYKPQHQPADADTEDPEDSFREEAAQPTTPADGYKERA